jgi:hypothetical protein
LIGFFEAARLLQIEAELLEVAVAGDDDTPLRVKILRQIVDGFEPTCVFLNLGPIYCDFGSSGGG